MALSTSAERVTVNSASAPSFTLSEGPLMERVALSSSTMVMEAPFTSSPPLWLPDTAISLPPSTTTLSVGVSVKLLVPERCPPGMVMLAALVAE